MQRRVKRFLQWLATEAVVFIVMGFALWILATAVQFNPVFGADDRRPVLDIWYTQAANCRAFMDAWHSDPQFRKAIEEKYQVRSIDACRVPEAAAVRGVHTVPCFEVRSAGGMRLFGFRGKEVLLAELGCRHLEAATPTPPAPDPPAPRPAPLSPALIVPNPELVAIGVKLDSLNRQLDEHGRRLQEPPRLDATPIADAVGKRLDDALSRHGAEITGRLAQSSLETSTGLGEVIDVVKGIGSTVASGGVAAASRATASERVFRVLGFVLSKSHLVGAVAGMVGTGGSFAIVAGAVSLVRFWRRRRHVGGSRLPGNSGPQVVGVPVTVDSPPSPQVVLREKQFVPVERDSHSEAFSYAAAEVVRKHPGSESVIAQLQSIIKQVLASKGVK